MIELERNSMALQANIHRDPKKQPMFTGKNFYRLSYEQVVEEAKKMTGQEAWPLMLERFKNKPLKGRNGG